MATSMPQGLRFHFFFFLFFFFHLIWFKSVNKFLDIRYTERQTDTQTHGDDHNTARTSLAEVV